MSREPLKFTPPEPGAGPAAFCFDAIKAPELKDADFRSLSREPLKFTPPEPGASPAASLFAGRAPYLDWAWPRAGLRPPPMTGRDLERLSLLDRHDTDSPVMPLGRVGPASPFFFTERPGQSAGRLDKLVAEGADDAPSLGRELVLGIETGEGLDVLHEDIGHLGGPHARSPHVADDAGGEGEKNGLRRLGAQLPFGGGAAQVLDLTLQRSHTLFHRRLGQAILRVARLAFSWAGTVSRVPAGRQPPKGLS